MKKTIYVKEDTTLRGKMIVPKQWYSAHPPDDDTIEFFKIVEEDKKQRPPTPPYRGKSIAQLLQENREKQ